MTHLTPKHYSIIYTYSILHNRYMFQRYYFALFRALTSTFV